MSELYGVYGVWSRMETNNPVVNFLRRVLAVMLLLVGSTGVITISLTAIASQSEINAELNSVAEITQKHAGFSTQPIKFDKNGLNNPLDGRGGADSKPSRIVTRVHPRHRHVRSMIIPGQGKDLQWWQGLFYVAALALFKLYTSGLDQRNNRRYGNMCGRPGDMVGSTRIVARATYVAN